MSNTNFSLISHHFLVLNLFLHFLGERCSVSPNPVAIATKLHFAGDSNQLLKSYKAVCGADKVFWGAERKIS